MPFQIGAQAIMDFSNFQAVVIPKPHEAHTGASLYCAEFCQFLQMTSSA